MDFFSGSMRNSHQKAMIFGGSMKKCTPFLGAVLRRHVSHPSRQSHVSFSSNPTPSHRATSFGSVFIIVSGGCFYLFFVQAFKAIIAKSS